MEKLFIVCTFECSFEYYEETIEKFVKDYGDGVVIDYDLNKINDHKSHSFYNVTSLEAFAKILDNPFEALGGAYRSSSPSSSRPPAFGRRHPRHCTTIGGGLSRAVEELFDVRFVVPAFDHHLGRRTGRRAHRGMRGCLHVVRRR